MSDMLCEKHLDLEWPHEDCPGPGVPIISGMRARISELETELLKQYRRVEDLISDSRVMERESAALRKRVEEIAWMHRDGYMCASSCDTCYLLKLTRALLESQGELMESLKSYPANYCYPTNDCYGDCNLAWHEDRTERIARAEAIRKGEV